MKKTIYLTALLLSLGCGKAPFEKSDFGIPRSNTGGIVGGTEIDSNSRDKNYRSLVLLMIEKTILFRDKQVKDHAYCTGVLIEPDVILTAAHCLVAERMKLVEKDFHKLKSVSVLQNLVKIDIGISFAAAPYDNASFKKILVHPEYKLSELVENNRGSTEIQNDLALILLNEKAPKATRSATLTTSAQLPVRQSIEVSSYGYGRKRHLNLEMYKKQKLSPPEQKREDNFLQTLRVVDTRASIDSTNKKFIFNQRNGKGLCIGDSGGPDFVLAPDGTPALVGIHSAINNLDIEWTDDNSPMVTNLDLCWAEAESTYLPAFNQWIRESIKSMRR